MNLDDLSHLSAADIDTLPFGFVGLSPDGTVRKYNRYEADLARRDPKEVLGRNFFTDVAPCTQVREFQGRFEQFVSGDIADASLSFEFEFAFRHGAQKVRIQFVRSPLDREVIMTVNRIRELSVPAWGNLERDAVRGSLTDPSGQALVVLGEDFWSSLSSLFETLPPEDRRQQFHRLGSKWGSRHIQRLERWIQDEHETTLRESELQVAFEALSESLRALGLGSFDVSLDHRDQGLLEVCHHNHPFIEWNADRDGESCSVLAGMHAGFLSYLSGRDLVAVETRCGMGADPECRFLVGTEARLRRLEASEKASSSDASSSGEVNDMGQVHAHA